MMAADVRPDYLTEECWTGDHSACSGYTEPSSDPDLCDCQCHDDLAAQLLGEDL